MSDDDALWKLAKAAAERIVKDADSAGFEVKPERGVFFRSDMGNLENDIYQWLEQHMVKGDGV